MARGTPDSVHIAGAGPAGLAAAITLASAGRAVIVHEARPAVGYRFRRDLQGLENWTLKQDVIAELKALGVSTAFDMLPCRRAIAFDPHGRAHILQSDTPIFYLVERGPGTHSLDMALLRQARALGVTVLFNSRLGPLDAPALLAGGPKAADAIAVGYHFDTDMADGVWVICDDTLAPQGYAYLLVMRGKATVKSCMFSGFQHQRVYAQRTVEAFRRLVGLEMRDPKPHGGVATFRFQTSAHAGERYLVGEEAGFQDALWGFGMRLAMRSGVLAARALMEGENYDTLWRRELYPWLRASIVNRVLYSTLGNRGYSWFLSRAASMDGRQFFWRQYKPSWFKRALEPWARMRYAQTRERHGKHKQGVRRDRVLAGSK